MKRYSLGVIAIVFLLSIFTNAVFAKEHEVKASFMKATLSFIKNNGQKDPSILYYEQGRGHVTAFGKEGISFSFSKLSKIKDKGQNSEMVTLTPLNASLFTIEAIEKKEGKINYFIGKDSSGWKSNISTYGAILYKNVYPGIDMKFYGTNSQLEYDIIVFPGADPSKILLAYTGIEKLSLTSTGDLEITLKGGSLLQKKPHIYQTIGNKIKEIEGKFILSGNTYSFEVGPYDRTHPIVIDPVLVYATYLGSYDGDNALGIAVDASGNTYVAGQTNSYNFPTQDPFQGSYGGGNYDAFVTKYDSSGILVYSSFLGGYDEDGANAITVDSSGNAYIAGYTYSTNFPTQNPYQDFNAGSSEVFVAKLSTSGSSLVYSTYLGGDSDDQAYGIAVDSSNNAYVTGYTYSSNFPTEDAFQASNAGGQDVFVTKLNPTGSALVYSTYLGGNNYDTAMSITVDSSNNPYVTGYTWSTNFPTQNAYQGSNAGLNDAFVTKFNSSGSALVYSTHLGGSDNDYAWGIAVDTSSNAYVAGSTGSTDFPTQNPYQRYNAGDNDVFVAKLSPSGSSLIYSTYLGGSAYDEAFGIKVDSAGSTYVAGYTYSTNFPTQNAYQEYFRGNADAFITKLYPTGDGLVYSTYLGGGNLDCANAIAVDSSGSAYVAGVTSSYDFPTQNPYQRYYSGIYDAFVAKLTPGHWLTVQKAGFGSVTSDPPGINCDPNCNEEFLKDHNITLTATAEPLSTFVGWNGAGCSGAGTCVVNMTEDVTVTATFHTFTLTLQKTGAGSGKVTSDPPGIDCGSACSELYGQGQPITLTPTPGFFSAFGGWSGGGCSGNDVCIVSLMEDITVTATFDRSPQEGTIGIQITMNESGFGTKKGKVLIGNTSTKIITWSPSSITCEVTKPLLPDLYSVTLTLKEPKGVAPITIPGAFIMMEPLIVSVDPSGIPGEEKTLSGNYFGTKKKKVYLDDQSTGQKKNCKVTSWSMNQTSGVSEIKFVVPKPKGYIPGISTSYNLKVTNKVGTASTTFSID